jgi:hypothetical protein
MLSRFFLRKTELFAPFSERMPVHCTRLTCPVDQKTALRRDRLEIKNTGLQSDQQRDPTEARKSVFNNPSGRDKPAVFIPKGSTFRVRIATLGIFRSKKPRFA